MTQERSPQPDSGPAAREYRQELELAAPPEAVWKALTEADELVRWFAHEAAIDPRPGGEVLWRWPEITSWPQRVEVVEEGRRLKTSYSSGVLQEGDRHATLFIDFTLEGHGGSTTLRLVHSGFGPEADFDGEFDGISRGWPVELQALRLYLEAHRGKERRLVKVILPVELQLDDAWARLIADDCLACGPIDELATGADFAFTTAAGERFEGRTLRCNPREFSGVDHAHGDAFLRVTVERCAGKNLVWVSLSTYGDEAEAQRLQRSLEGVVQAAITARAAS